MASKPVYRWTRSLHLYLGLFISPFVLIFALSVFFLNHAALPWGGEEGAEKETRTRAVSVVDRGNSLELASQIQRQIDVPGEIDFINRNETEHRVTFPITSPGEKSSIRLDLATGIATIETRKSGVWDAMVYLHKMPGPHNAALRGNWLYTRMWGWLADWTVYLTLFVTASGVYLWTAVRAERRAGLLFLGTGMLSFILVVVALLA
jgi:hypothetical protein